VRTVLAIVLLACGTARGGAGDADMILPVGNSSVRLRLELAAGEVPVDRAWTTFLDRLFDYFDRDGNGSLSAAEAARVFALPLPEGRELALDFAALDADHDGKASKAEFRVYYRSHGFTPVVLINEIPPREILVLGECLFRHLDRDGDHKLSAAELRQATALLRRFDEDEDEVLTAAELRGSMPPQALLAPAGMKLTPVVEGSAPAAVLRLPIGEGQPLLHRASAAFHLANDGSQLRVPGGNCRLSVATDDPLTGFRAARKFYRAQFNAIAGDRPAEKKLFEDDPSAGVLAGLFDAADRNGDGKLTVAELEAFFDLMELGIQCQVVITAVDRGRNLFDRIDTNVDGKLDLGELTRAARDLPGELASAGPLEPSTVPASYRLSVSRGPVAASFGPIPFGSATKPKPAPLTKATGVPRWFQAMDRNGDGYVSRQEFIGSPEAFTHLDMDGDGRISIEEATRASKP
jgi:Ca2+-binding EF-hand superfamily protein